MPWARKGSKFTLLFKQVAMNMVKEMPVLAAARIIGITDKRLWRIVFLLRQLGHGSNFSEIRQGHRAG
ncbi:MAG TPA: transposase family protein [Phycisphaerales bacterium]|nr:transposase family protein [Phycisphaerales bacterium]